MKMKKGDYLKLRDAIKGTGWSSLSTMRLRWDALWASNFNINPLYDYLNDDHIDTALRAIAREIG